MKERNSLYHSGDDQIQSGKKNLWRRIPINFRISSPGRGYPLEDLLLEKVNKGGKSIWLLYF